MEILEFLEGIRTEFGVIVNLAITNLGSEMLVVGILCFFLWCNNKKFAYRLGIVYFISGLAVQTLKIIFKIPRPWIVNDNLLPVDKAVDTATGYSFPSGHTQSATALYGTLAYCSSKKWFQFVMFALILAVGFSRMYLGVHTPLDVSVSLFITILITVLCNYVIDKKIIYKLSQEMVAAILLMIPMAMVVYAVVVINNGNVEIENVEDYLKAAGAALGFAAGWYLESKYLNFDENQGKYLSKALRYIIGVALLLVVKEGLKYIVGDCLVADFVRYAITIFWGIFLYPMLFTKVNNIVAKEQN